MTYERIRRSSSQPLQSEARPSPFAPKPFHAPTPQDSLQTGQENLEQPTQQEIPAWEPPKFVPAPPKPPVSRVQRRPNFDKLRERFQQEASQGLVEIPGTRLQRSIHSQTIQRQAVSENPEEEIIQTASLVSSMPHLGLMSAAPDVEIFRQPTQTRQSNTQETQIAQSRGRSRVRGRGKKPEIEATEKAIGDRVVNQVDVINQEASANTGIHYAHQFEEKAIQYRLYPDTSPELKEFADKWKDEYWSGYADEKYFEKKGFMHWVLKPGVKASEAIKRWLNGGTIAECETALIAINYDTMRAAIGDDKFDELFSSLSGKPPKKGLLQITSTGNREAAELNPLNEFMMETKAAQEVRSKGDAAAGTPGNRPVKKGEWYYFYNHPMYLLKHPAGAFQGENAICMDDTPGAQKWAGFGVSSVTEKEMLEEMAETYNDRRDENDYRRLLQLYASDVLQQKKDETYQELYNKHQARIPKEYHKESGIFPANITPNDILNAPAYTIGNTTRKGGFLIQVGKVLNHNKLQEIRKQ
jgi:hypothetical protein